MVLFIGSGVILIYITVVLACIFLGIRWAKRKQIGLVGRSGVVLLILLVAYAIPFGDHAIGLMRLKQLCDEQAGVRIIRTVDQVEGFAWETERLSRPDTYGYLFFETIARDGNIFRYRRMGNGGVSEDKGMTLKSKYIVKRNPRIHIAPHTTKSEFVISEVNSGKTIASSTSIYYEGGWLIRGLSAIGVSGHGCPKQPANSLWLVQRVLKPQGDKQE